MGKSAEEHIPADVLYAAKRAGLRTPLWYVGRSNGHEGKKLERNLDDVVRDAYEAAGKLVPQQKPANDGD